MKTKKLLSMMLFLLIIIGGCDNNSKPENIISGETTLIGHWEWIKTYAMIPLSETNPQTPQNAGYTEQLVLNADSSWYKVKNGNVIDSGEKFTAGRGAYYYLEERREYDSIAYYKNNTRFGTDYYELKNDTLIFSIAFANPAGSGSIFWKKQLTTSNK